METRNLDIYGHEPIPWSRAEEQLAARKDQRTWWLATTNPDGSPHVAGTGAVWVGGKIYFVSGARTRKSRNVGANPRCSFSVSLPGIDVVVEGTAARVTDPQTLNRVVKLYQELGWPAEVRDGSIVAPYSAPSAGPAPWELYEVTPISATGVASESPDGASRWIFDRA